MVIPWIRVERYREYKATRWSFMVWRGDHWRVFWMYRRRRR